jgi:sec-independent protein translocase protein TatA
MMGLDNPIHIAFLLLVVLLVFGAKRLPEIGRSLGAGMRGFKDSITGENVPPPASASRPELPAQAVSASLATPALAPVATPAAASVATTVAAPTAIAVAEPIEEPSPPSAA